MDPDSYISNLSPTTVCSCEVSYTLYIACGVFVFLLFASGIISALRTAVKSLNPIDLNFLKEDTSSESGSLNSLLLREEQLLAGLLITQTFVKTTIAVLSSYLIHSFFYLPVNALWRILLEVLLIAFLLILFSEIIPKFYLHKPSLKLLYSRTKTLAVINALSSPLSALLLRSYKTISNLRISRNFHSAEEEQTKTIELTATEMPEEKEMLKEILQFHNKTASEIMTPRMDINDVEINMSFEEVLETVIPNGYSRIPVYNKTQDNIQGILYIKDLIPYIGKDCDFSWQNHLRQAYFVAETKKIDELLDEFRTKKIHMAIVTDEYGGTSGIITMEDILEEIVGEIEDEYDTEEAPYSRQADGSIVFEAKIALIDFYKAIHVEANIFEELTEDVDTLGGLLLEIKGEFPSINEVISFKDYQFKVLEMENRRIQKIQFNRHPKND